MGMIEMQNKEFYNLNFICEHSILICHIHARYPQPLHTRSFSIRETKLIKRSSGRRLLVFTQKRSNSMVVMQHITATGQELILKWEVLFKLKLIARKHQS